MTRFRGLLGSTLYSCYFASPCDDGSTGFAGGTYPGGKLTRRYGYNWIPLIGPIVDEKFTYSDSGGSDGTPWNIFEFPEGDISNLGQPQPETSG